MHYFILLGWIALPIIVAELYVQLTGGTGWKK